MFGAAPTAIATVHGAAVVRLLAGLLNEQTATVLEGHRAEPGKSGSTGRCRRFHAGRLGDRGMVRGCSERESVVAGPIGCSWEVVAAAVPSQVLVGADPLPWLGELAGWPADDSRARG